MLNSILNLATQKKLSYFSKYKFFKYSIFVRNSCSIWNTDLLIQHNIHKHNTIPTMY